VALKYVNGIVLAGLAAATSAILLCSQPGQEPATPLQQHLTPLAEPTGQLAPAYKVMRAYIVAAGFATQQDPNKYPLVYIEASLNQPADFRNAPEEYQRQLFDLYAVSETTCILDLEQYVTLLGHYPNQAELLFEDNIFPASEITIDPITNKFTSCPVPLENRVITGTQI
jgi:hypothetical protein